MNSGTTFILAIRLILKKNLSNSIILLGLFSSSPARMGVINNFRPLQSWYIMSHIQWWITNSDILVSSGNWSLYSIGPLGVRCQPEITPEGFLDIISNLRNTAHYTYYHGYSLTFLTCLPSSCRTGKVIFLLLLDKTLLLYSTDPPNEEAYVYLVLSLTSTNLSRKCLSHLRVDQRSLIHLRMLYTSHNIRILFIHTKYILTRYSSVP